ncbi:MAG: hypothetical protein R2874_02780 [Desulfobacterales bacterium]
MGILRLPDFKTLLTKGVAGITADIDQRRAAPNLTEDRENALISMTLCRGISTYAKNLAKTAAFQARSETDAAAAGTHHHLKQ